MRNSRLLSILMLLQARGRLSASVLAREMDVAVRTIYRDVAALEAAGVPMMVERGAAGGFALLEGWRTRLTGLTPAEAQAIFLSGLPGPASQLGLGEAVASAQLKILAALPANWQDDAQRVGSRFHLDPLDWYRDPARIVHLPQVANAVWTARRLWMRYESWKGDVERNVDPLGLVLKAGEWYLVAAVLGTPRTYRLSNVLELRITDEAAQRPKIFDLAAYWAESVARFERELNRATALVRVSTRGRKWLRAISASVAQAVDGTDSEIDANGWQQVRIPIESIEHAAQSLIRLGPECEVLEPQPLRAALATIAENTAALYRC
jgi:predicted DNA-binding transcriptional regulator YafY